LSNDLRAQRPAERVRWSAGLGSCIAHLAIRVAIATRLATEAQETYVLLHPLQASG